MVRLTVLALSIATIIFAAGATRAQEPAKQNEPAKPKTQQEEEIEEQAKAKNKEPADEDSPATKKQIDALLEAMKNASAVNASEDEYIASITCVAVTGTCTPKAVFFNKPGVSFVKIILPKAGSPLDVLVTAGERGPAKAAAKTGNGDTIAQAHVRRHYDKAPNVIMVALRKIGYREVIPSSDSATVVNPVIDFGLYAQADELQVFLTSGDDGVIALSVPLRYHRWHVQLGGFLAFNTVVDQELVTHAEGSMVIVDKKRERDSLTPVTGAAVNIHPSASPTFGFQFGLATNSNRQPSYFAGGAYRLRGLGPQVVLTVAAGVAAIPTLRFRDVKVGDVRAADDAALKGAVAYRFGPYLGLTFGFTFGDGASAATKPASK
jgi:hypothetical protein